ncbi:hypothetical protein DRO55_01115 [Candidatus Bathyarchaeota archaeon]|nr:MAG: hypothetical protein DRO55_01115 [Candidatus Bathyarchaeota archaeon]
MSGGEAKFFSDSRLLKILMDNIPDSIYFKDSSSRFIMVSNAHAKNMGLKSPEEARGKTDFDFYAEDFAREAYEDERRIIETGQPLINKIEKIVTKNGTIRWVSATKVPIFNDHGRVIGIVGISRDITKYMEMQRQMRLLSSVVEQVSEGIAVTDTNGKIIFANPAWAEMHGYEENELIEMDIHDLYERPEIARKLENEALTKGNAKGRLGHVKKNGDVFPTLTSWNIIKDREGKTIGIAIITKSLTDIIRVLRDVKTLKSVEER